MAESFDYRKAYEQVSRDLKKTLDERDRLDRKITGMRTTLQALAVSCENKGIEIQPSLEAEYLLTSSTLPEEILEILRNQYPGYHRATVIKNKLEQLGHDMTKYQNPLATIHMILKRQIDANKVETGTNDEGEKLYRYRLALGERIVSMGARAKLKDIKPGLKNLPRIDGKD